jgi:hypothetical protein
MHRRKRDPGAEILKSEYITEKGRPSAVSHPLRECGPVE